VPEGFSGDGGPATSAMSLGLRGLAVDAQGYVYIGDGQSYRARKVTVGAQTVR